MRYIKLTLGLATLGALVGLVLAALVAANSSPDDIVYVPFGELALWLSITGVVLGGAIGLVGSLVWALYRWIAGRCRRQCLADVPHAVPERHGDENEVSAA